MTNPTADAPTAAPPPSPLVKASERLRESAKWLLATFGAVGAVLAAGVALGNMKSLQTDGDRTKAIIAAGVAAVGIVIAVVAAGRILAASYVTLMTVKDRPRLWKRNADKDILGNTQTVEGLRTSFLAPQTEFHAAHAALVAAPQETEQLRDNCDRASAELSVYTSYVRRLIERRSFEKVRRAYLIGAAVMAVGALLTFGGLVGFVAITARPTPPSAPVVGKTPVEVVVTVKDSVRGDFVPMLGCDCDLANLAGTAIANVGENVIVAVAPTTTCKQNLVTFAPGQADVNVKPSE